MAKIAKSEPKLKFWTLHNPQNRQNHVLRPKQWQTKKGRDRKKIEIAIFLVENFFGSKKKLDRFFWIENFVGRKNFNQKKQILDEFGKILISDVFDKGYEIIKKFFKILNSYE